MKLFEDFIETSAKVADQVAKVAGEYIDKGKDKISVLSLENELAKAQRQLGALVYVLKKTGEENEELLNQYIDDVAKLEFQIASFKAESETHEAQSDEVGCSDTAATKECPSCKGTVGNCDLFCRSCGAKI